jgi:GTP-binding protein
MIRVVESKFITSAVKTSGYPDTTYPDFAFVGRSNVGKSSMINTLTNRRLLAKIANKPGKTRLINFFECRFLTEPLPEIDEKLIPRHFCLVDLPGYGYAKVSQTERDSWTRMIGEFFRNRNQLCGVIVLVDIRHDPDPKDKVMIQMLREHRRDFMVAATKCDKISAGKVFNAIKKFKTEFHLTDEFICEFSSVSKKGYDQILNWIETKIYSVVLNSKVIIHE